MPLSSLSTVNTALNNIYDTAKTAPMPLDAIEARRASNQAERLAEYEAGTKRMTANEYGRAGEATRATEAATALVLKQIGPPPKDTRSPEYTQWVRESAGILISSGDQSALKLGNEMLSKLEQTSKTGQLDPGTQGGAQAAAGIDLKGAQTRAQDVYTKAQQEMGRIPLRELSDQELIAIDQAIDDIYPEQSDWKFWTSVDKDKPTIAQQARILIMKSRTPGQTPLTPKQAVKMVKEGAQLPTTSVPQPPPVGGSDDPMGLF